MSSKYSEMAVLPETNELTAKGEIWRDIVRGIDRISREQLRKPFRSESCSGEKIVNR